MLATLSTGALAINRREIIKERDNSYPAFYSPGAYFEQMKIEPGDTSSLTNETIDFEQTCTDWAQANLQLTATDKANRRRGYVDATTGLYHCYMIKESSGIEIVNSVAQLTWTATGQMLSHGQTWVETDDNVNLVKRGEGITCDQALQKVAISLQEPETGWTSTEKDGVTTFTDVPFASNDVTCAEKLYQTEGGTLQHVYALAVPTSNQYLNLMVDKASGTILAAADWTSHMAYTASGRLVKRHVSQLRKRQAPPAASLLNPTFRALQLGALDPKTVKPSLIADPVDFTASPNGWINAKGDSTGNNVIATENSAGLLNVKGLAINGKKAKAQNFVFDYKIDDTAQDPSQYQEASITNAFFLSNRFHDIFYKYGFDEKSGNFQQDNFGKGGKAADPVIALVQDGSGVNNANFQTPPDGTSGVMRMFIFTSTTPRRDGALENAVANHELAHGLSMRLTGGPDAANCLSTPIGGGLGEGWSDIVAIVLEMEEIDLPTTPKPVGQYVTGDAQKGVRQFPYSTNLQTNPNMYGFAAQTKEVHAVGEIWASMLFEVYWNMVGTAGFDPSFRTNAEGVKGNNMFLKTLVASLKIQPCNPDFITARDAFLTADQQLSQGKFKCEISKGFAKRGLGVNAKANFVNDFAVPSDCPKN